MEKTYRGKVLLEGGAPLENVLVTDGRNVVKTDFKGEFTLKGFPKSHFIYITVPAGFKCEDFFIPIEENREEYNFSLQKSEKTLKKEHTFIHISDTEIGERSTLEWIDNLKKGVKETDAVFLINTGDICYEYGLKNHIKVMNSENMGCTVRYTIGNHDFLKGAFGEELYESIYGPTWYSFEVGNIHYVVTPITRGLDNESLYSEEDVFTWLKNDLENKDKSKKVIVFNHTKSISEDYTYLKNDLDLKEHNLIGWFFGHYHYNMAYENEGVLNFSATRPNGGGIDSSLAGYRVVNISENDEITTFTKYYDLDEKGEPQGCLLKRHLQGNILFSSISCKDGNIFVGTSCDDYPHSCGVYSLNAEALKINWFFKTKNSIKNNVSVTKDKVIAMDCEGNVYCLNGKTGALLWENRCNIFYKLLGTSSAPTVEKDIVIAGNSGNIYAFNLSDGSLLWHNDYGKGESSPAEFTVYKEKVFVNAHWGALVALDLFKGTLIWENKDSKMRFRTSAPTFYNNRLFAVGNDSIAEIDIENGSIIWLEELKDFDLGSSGKITIENDIAYIPTANKGLLTFNINTKKILWNFETRANIIFSAPYSVPGFKTVEGEALIYNEKVIFGGNDGYIYILNKNGERLREYYLGSASLGTPLIKDGKIYVGTFHGDVSLYEV